MNARFVIYLFLAVFLLLPNAVAMWLLNQAKATEKRVDIATALDGQFAESGLFVAEGKLRSPAGGGLKSMHFGLTCLAFRIKFDLRHTVTDSDGDQEDKRLELFEERHQVKDLEVDFGVGKGLLDIQVLETFYKPGYEELEELPEYVPYDRIPKVKTEKFWFEVYETRFTDGQIVTVLGQRNQLGLLEASPGIGELIVFPGSKAKYLEKEAASSIEYRYVAYILIAFSFVVCGVLLLVLKFMKK